MESEMDVVTTIDLQTADEFLDALRPRSDHFKNLRDGGSRNRRNDMFFEAMKTIVLNCYQALLD